MAFLDFVRKYRKFHASAYIDDKKDAQDKDAFRVSGTQEVVVGKVRARRFQRYGI